MPKKSTEEVGVEVTIRLVGQLPKKYLTLQQIKRIEDRIRGDIIEQLGEYEIWGEFFGSDENIYALFLDSVKLNQKRLVAEPTT